MPASKVVGTHAKISSAGEDESVTSQEVEKAIQDGWMEVLSKKKIPPIMHTTLMLRILSLCGTILKGEDCTTHYNRKNASFILTYSILKPPLA